MKKLETLESFSLDENNLSEVKGGSLWRWLGNASLVGDIYDAVMSINKAVHGAIGQPEYLRGVK